MNFHYEWDSIVNNELSQAGSCPGRHHVGIFSRWRSRTQLLLLFLTIATSLAVVFGGSIMIGSQATSQNASVEGQRMIDLLAPHSGARITKRISSTPTVPHFGAADMSWSLSLAWGAGLAPMWCWNHNESSIVLAFQLGSPSYISLVAIESKAAMLCQNYRIAPREIQVWGIPANPGSTCCTSHHGYPHAPASVPLVHLGRLSYDAHMHQPYQWFLVTHNTRCPVEGVLFEIKRNWGASNLTCVGQFRALGWPG